MNEISASKHKAPFFYSLSSVCDNFEFKAREILDLAINGDIVLSIKIPCGYSPYLMSVADTETSKTFGFLTYTKKSLANISMLPKQVDISYLNLSQEDCEVLKVSNLEQSIFGSAFSRSHSSDSNHHVLKRDSSVICGFGLDPIHLRLKEEQISAQLTQDAGRLNALSPQNRKRLIAGINAVQLGRYVRRFVLINDTMELDDLGWFGFLASSTLNQSMIKTISITQHDIVISSNYSGVLERSKLAFKQAKEQEISLGESGTIHSKQVTIDDIPVNSAYYLPPNCRYSAKLKYLAVLGFCLYDKESLPTPKNLTVYIQNDLSISKKEAEAAAFFINPNPNGKMKEEYRYKPQFGKLVKVHEEFYLKGKLKNKNKDAAVNYIPNSFGSYGYSDEKSRYAAKLITPDK